MPSKSLSKFETKLVTDVMELAKTHSQLSGDGPGRRAFGHLTRGGVVMLCAAWEIYLEELCREAVAVYCQKLSDPRQLPHDPAKEISNHVKNHKHELRPLDLAQDGWKRVFESLVDGLIGTFNTPKAGPTNELFRRAIGLHDLSDGWDRGAGAVDDFVTRRGDVAHRGSQATYIRINELNSYLDLVRESVVQTDNAVAEHLRDTTPGRRLPWRRR